MGGLSPLVGVLLLAVAALGVVMFAQPVFGQDPPGSPTSVAVYSVSSRQLEVRWSLSTFGAVTSFEVQWKSGSEEFDSSRQVVADPAASVVSGSSTATVKRYKHTITGLSDGTEYTVRVVATNTHGDGDPSSEATGIPQSMPGQARLFVENEVVKPHEGDYPWLRSTWDYITDQNVTVRLKVGGDSGVLISCSPDQPMESNLRKCYASEVTIRRDSADLIPTITHELGHVHTLANSVTDSPGPLAIVHLYFDQLELGGRFCIPRELFTDTMMILVHGGPFRNYWSQCSGWTRSGRSISVTDEARDVVKSAVAGDMPSWFADTYSDGDGGLDLEQLWADVKAVPTPKVRAGVVFQLRGEFGGYCDNEKVTGSAFGTGVTRNPWRDGGCVPEEPGDVAATAAGNGRLTVSWDVPAGDGGSPVEGYKVQWKSDTQAYDSSRQADLADLSYTISGLTDGTEYTVRVLAYNHNGDGEGSETQATPTATGRPAHNHTTSVAIVSDPGSDMTYVVGDGVSLQDEIDVTVTFGENVEAVGTPELALQIGDVTKQATYREGSGTTRLRFRYTVAEGDEDTDGLSVPAGVIGGNGTISYVSDGSAAPARVELATQPSHKVDGVRPVLLSATPVTNGNTLTLTWDKGLDETSIPVPRSNAFRVWEGGGTLSDPDHVYRTVTHVSISSQTVTLTLASTIMSSDVLTTRYCVPPSTYDPLKDTFGNYAACHDTTAMTMQDTTPPTISGATSITYTENRTDRVAVYSATDPENDTVTWSLAGTDAAAFTITDGVLTLSQTPDYEQPADSDTTNEYLVTVRAWDGSNYGTLDVIVTVTNMDEDGTLGLSSVHPQVGAKLEADLSDPDGSITALGWMWERSPTGTSSWSTISSATKDAYTPADADLNQYLRVRTSYTDGEGPGKTAAARTTSTVTNPTQPPPRKGGGRGGGRGGGGGGSSGGEVDDGLPPTASELFEDINPGVWYEQAVTWMILHKVTSGCATTMFCPDANLTRQQFVTFLWRAAGRPTPTYQGSEAFKDVPEGTYSDRAIGWAVSNGTTVGCTQGTFGDPDWRFCPTRPVTRGQMATLLYRHVEADHTGAAPPYTDVEPDKFYTPSITWLTDFQVVPGCGPQLFCPNRNATRAEAALFINGVAIRPHIWGPGNTSFRG